MYIEWTVVKQLKDSDEGLKWEGLSLLPDDLGQQLIEEINKYNPLVGSQAIEGIDTLVYFNFFFNLLFRSTRFEDRNFIQIIPLEFFREYINKWNIQSSNFITTSEDGGSLDESESEGSLPFSDDSIESLEEENVIISIPEMEWVEDIKDIKEKVEVKLAFIN